MKRKTAILILSIFAVFAAALFFINSKGTWLANAVCYECVTSVYDVFCDDALYDGTGKCPFSTTVTYDTSPGCPSQRCVNGGESEGCGHLEWCACGTKQVDDSFCPAPSCEVSWSNVPSTSKGNANFTATITQGSSNVGWNNVMTYKDGVVVPGGTVVSGGYTWVINSGLPGSHQLQFKVNDPNAGGSGTATTCTPSKSFNTIAPPTASIQKPADTEGSGSASDPVLLKSSEPYTFSAVANGTNMRWVRIFYGLKSTVDSHISSPQNSDWTLIAENNNGRTDGKVCESSTQCSTGLLDPWTPTTPPTQGDKYYVMVRANQVDGAGNAMPCGGDPHLDNATGSSATSGWSNCGPSDRLTVDVSDVEAELKIEAAVSTAFSGAPRTSGKLSTQGGVGFVNPMKITLSKKAGSVDIKDFYLALHSGSELASETDFVKDADNATLQDRISGDPQKGFLLWYAPQGSDKDVDYCPASGQGGKFYVWNGGCWTDAVDSPRVEETEVGARVYRVCKDNNCGSNPILFSVSPDPQNSDSTKATWQVEITEDFTGKSLWTPIYAVDTGGRQGFNSDFIKPENRDAATGNYTGTIHFR